MELKVLELEVKDNERMSFYKKALEALLFSAGRPLKLKELYAILDKALPEREIERLIEELMREYEGRGVRIRKVAEGYRVETAEELSGILRKFFQPKTFKWSRALLETLAIIAYFQPITRAEISAKRGGVEVSPYLKVLLERGFIKVVGKKEIPGRPALYGTTSYFLEYFGLNSLKDLPPLEEIQKLLEREAE